MGVARAGIALQEAGRIALDPAALDLATYLRSPETQQWIAGFGRGRYDDQPLFFPVSLL